MALNEKSSAKDAGKRPPMPKGAPHGVEVVSEGIGWYRLTAKKLFTVVLAETAVIFVLGFSLAWLATHRPKPNYFATTPDMRMVKMVPLDQPYVSSSGLLDWSVETVTSTMSFDFLSYQKQLESVRDRYTQQAFSQMIGAIQASGILTKVKEDRLATSATPTAAPVILGTGVVDGQRAWKIQFPMVITYQSSNGVAGVQKAMVNMIVMRQNTLQYPKGIAVTQVLIQ